MTTLLKRPASWALFAILTAVAFCSCAAVRAQEPVCPFNDDSIIFYSSPTSLAKAGIAMNKKYGFQDELACVNKLLDKADAELAKLYNDEEFPKEQFDYYHKLFQKATGQDSFVRGLLVSYFKYVDGVVVAVELGDSFQETKDMGADPLSLTVFFNANPSALDAREYLKDDPRVSVEVTKEEENHMAGNVTIKKDDGDKLATIYFAGVKLSDCDKYAVVFGSRANTEKKAERLLKTSEFITKRLAEPGLVDERIIKEKAFKVLSEAIAATRDTDDDAIKTSIKIVDTLKAARVTVTANEDGYTSQLCVEVQDEETAQGYVDLLNGGVAVMKLAASNKKDKGELKPEEELGLEALSTVKIERDGVKAKAKAVVSVELLRKAFAFAKEKCDR